MKTVKKFLLNTLIYIVIIGGVVFGMPKFLAWSLGTQYPMAAITSGSMWPALKEGDLVFIQGTQKKEDLKTGDIVVFRNPGTGFTIHRVVELRDTTLVTKGDANFTKDEPVTYENVVGKTFQVFGKNVRLPYLGFITVYATRK